MFRHPSIVFRSVVFGALVCLLAAGALARPRPSSDLLLPCFEVRMDNSLTTVLAVGNSSIDSVPVRISLLTNWGLEVFSTPLTLGPEQVRSINLYDWLVLGRLPDRTLSEITTKHLQTALCGEASSTNGFYYSTLFDPTDPQLMVGAVLIQVAGGQNRPDVLWGDYFVVDQAENYAQGDVLVDVDPSSEGNALCKHHLLRFLEGGSFDAGTMVMLWNPSLAGPLPTTEYPESAMIEARSRALDEKGRPLGTRTLLLHPLEMVSVGDLGLPQPFGWLDVITEEPTYISMHYRADGRYAAGLEAHCLDQVGQGPGGTGAQVTLEKKVQGFDADEPPGPTIPVGTVVEWTYVVTNSGDTALYEIAVSDDHGVEIRCPKRELEPGESMTCTGNAVAVACQYVNVGRVVAHAVTGGFVSDDDLSYYFGQPNAAVDLEKHTFCIDNDQPPGPEVIVGTRVDWTYVVTNVGSEPIYDIQVIDDQGVRVTCPRRWLSPGQTIKCIGHANAVAGQYRNVGTVSATSTCGVTLSDTDPDHYFGVVPPPNPEGCTPGYWKNHHGKWPPTGYSPTQSVVSVFSAAIAYPSTALATLHQALGFGGGPGADGAAQILLRAATAALLNAAHPDVNYPRTVAEVITPTDAALASGVRDTMLALAAELDADNNLGCPLS